MIDCRKLNGDFRNETIKKIFLEPEQPADDTVMSLKSSQVETNRES